VDRVAAYLFASGNPHQARTKSVADFAWLPAAAKRQWQVPAAEIVDLVVPSTVRA